MIIKRVEPIILSHTLNSAFSFSQWEYRERKICIVKITTDEGLVGWGEGYGPASVLAAGIDFLKPCIIGENALNSDMIWTNIYRRTLDYARRGVLMASVSAIDIAIWDLKGKILQQPVSILLGGKRRDKIKAYATGLYFSKGDDLAEKLAEEALSYKEQGFQLVKMKVGLSPENDLKNIKRVRKAIGSETKLMVDSNHAYSLNEALKLSRMMEDYDISWFEEPLGPEYYDQYRELRSKTNIPIAAGECEYLKFGFHHLFRNSSVDIAQPDICASGGITEVKKIISLAQTYGVDIVPHSWGTGIALSAALQVLSNMDVIPGRMFDPDVLMEFDCTENALRENLLHTKIEAINGFVKVPEDVGLGIEVDEKAVDFYRVN